MANFSITLFGIDFIPTDHNYQFWLFGIKNWDNDKYRCLLAAGIIEGEFCLEILFITLKGNY